MEGLGLAVDPPTNGADNGPFVEHPSRSSA
jgi:hypothetical protein